MRARAAQLALVDGDMGAEGKIVAIELLADPERLGGLDLKILDG